MRTQWWAVVAGTAVLVLIPSAAQAALVADWQMDEGPGASVMADSAGGDNNGTTNGVVTGDTGLAGGKAYQFDGSTSWVDVPDKPNLDPGSQSITVKATVRIHNGEILDDSYEVARKGTVKTVGGEWKMEIKRSSTTVGKLRCVFKGVLSGSTALVAKQASPDVVDGQIHTLQCRRTGNTVTAVVDGRSFSTAKASGTIANAEPVIIGAKVAGDDVMNGVIDAVSISIG